MSAFMVDQEHITAMVTLGRGRVMGVASAPCETVDVRWARFDPAVTPWREQEWRRIGRPEDGNVTATEIGRMLAQENAASLGARYGDEPEPWVLGYEYPTRQLQSMVPGVVEGLRLIDCYEYQACEHEGWYSSEAYRYCDALRRALIGHLPGYDEAPWEWSRRAVARYRQEGAAA